MRERMTRGYHAAPAICGYVAGTLAMMVLPYFNKRIVDAVEGNAAELGVESILVGIFGVVAIYLLSLYAMEYLREALRLRLEAIGAKRLFCRALSLPLDRLWAISDAEWLTYLSTDAVQVAKRVLHERFSFWVYPLHILLLAGALAWWDLRLTAVALALIPFYVLSLRPQTRRIVALQASSVEAQQRGIASLRTFVEHAGSMHLDRKEGDIRARLMRPVDLWLREKVRFSFFYLLARRIPVVIAMASPLLLYWVGAGQVLRGSMRLGDLMMFIGWAVQMYLPVRMLSESYVEWKSIQPHVARLDALEAPGDGAYEALFCGEKASIRGASVRTQDGRFLYDAQIDLPDRGLVVLKGPNGSGKTTLLSLLAGLIPLSQLGEDAEVTLPKGWKGRMALLRYPLFFLEGSVAENIALGRTGLRQLPRIFSSMPPERTVTPEPLNLSSGEAQKIALLRVLCQDAEVYFLDEPTSNLEDKAREELLDYVRGDCERALYVLIMHDASLDEAADLVYRIQDGALVPEKGGVR